MNIYITVMYLREAQRTLMLATIFNALAYGLCIAASGFTLRALLPAISESLPSKKRIVLAHYASILFALATFYMVPIAIDQAKFFNLEGLPQILKDPNSFRVQWWSASDSSWGPWFLQLAFANGLMYHMVNRALKANTVPNIYRLVFTVAFYLSLISIALAIHSHSFLQFVIISGIFNDVSAAILLVYYIIRRKSGNNERPPLFFVISALSMDTVQILWIIALFTFGGFDKWLNALVFVVLFAVQNLFIVRESQEIVGYIQLPTHVDETE